MKKYKCGHCKKTYEKLWMLFKHMLDAHQIEEPRLGKKNFVRC